MSRQLEHEESDVIDVLLHLQDAVPTTTPKKQKKNKYDSNNYQESPLPLPSLAVEVILYF